MITEDQLERAWEVFDEWGLEVAKSPYLFDRDGYFAGTDGQRLEEWEWALSTPGIKAIFCARGGYGLTRIVDDIDLSALQQNPVWIVGFSDITALHLALKKRDLASLHALMPVQYGYEGVDKSLESLHTFLFDGKLNYTPDGKILQTGETIAPVVGGNLSLLAESLGTASEIESAGCILFIEEIDEYLYKVDRMMNQLRRAGKFENITGLILGDFSDIKDTAIPFGKTLDEIIHSYISPSIPVVMDLPMGHENFNLALPLNLPVHLCAGTDGITITCDHNLRHPVS